MTRYIKSNSAQVEAAKSKSMRYDEESGCLVISDSKAPLQTAGIKTERPRIGSSHPRFPPPMITLGSSGPPLNTTVQGVDFSMYICGDSPLERNHMFTTIQSQNGAQAKMLDGLGDWQRYFPDLPACLNDTKSEACDIILLESNMSLIETSPPDGSNISIHFDVDINCNQNCRDWQLRTTFYRNKGKLEKIMPKRNLSSHIVDYSKIKLGDMTLYSPWWAQLFANVIAQRRAVRERENKKLEDAGHGQWLAACWAIYDIMLTLLVQRMRRLSAASRGLSKRA